jgi:hypothetical protein
MFVRYRKITADGTQPHGVQAKINCHGRCKRGRRLQCPIKPRCRWRIGLEIVDDAMALALVPYRLQVSLIENHRRDGRVRQEHIADLGTIPGHLLPEFWAGIDPALAAKLKRDDWDLHSTKARLAFWEAAKPRLDRLANRLDPKAIRMIVHHRIPWPKQAERELAEAREDFRFWKSQHEADTKILETHERMLSTLMKQTSEQREMMHKHALLAGKAGERLAKLR